MKRHAVQAQKLVAKEVRKFPKISTLRHKKNDNLRPYLRKAENLGTTYYNYYLKYNFKQ